MLDAGTYERELRPLLDRGAGYARSLVGNRDDAEDAVQQASLRAWERIGQYDTARPFAGWWFAILRNCCHDVLRSKKRSRAESLDGVDVPDTGDADETDWKRLDASLRSLSSSHEEVLRLRYFGGLTYDQLAEALRIPKGTVMSRLHLGRKALAARRGRDDPGCT